jgi:polysaccharide biosynthesis protein VpsM
MEGLLRRLLYSPSIGGKTTRLALCPLLLALIIASDAFFTPASSPAQQSTIRIPSSGGQGDLWLSQFANPSLVGSLYGTPAFPLTGYYPSYPGSFTPVMPEDGISLGPVALHPHMGFAEMYTDNVFRTASNRISDFSHTLSPGMQAQLPVAGRHMFLLDYRTNLQYHERTPSNDVQDQTGSGRFTFNSPLGLKVDLQGEHRVGHDPRGSAVDIQALEINKWETNSFVGEAEYFEGVVGARVRARMNRWNYQNNNQDVVRDRLSNYLALGLLGRIASRTSGLLNLSVQQEIYDQNKNLDSAIYVASAGARWDITAVTSGEIQLGYQYLKYTRAQVNQPPPLLSQFNNRNRDSFGNFFVAGNLTWSPTSFQVVGLQIYRTIQQSAFAGTQFFLATGINLSLIHNFTDRFAFMANLGYENDDFEGTSTVGGPTERSDTLKNVAVGLRYRTVKWLGASVQYMYEDRTSDLNNFAYHANTLMVAIEALF